MNWRFTLIDRFATDTIVDQPVGWNGISGNLTRDIINHGISINISTESFEWVNDAYDLLYAEYQTHGANGQYDVQIDYECSEGDGYTNYFTGAFDFNTFERQCSDYCFIKISVTASKCTDVFMSRMGQDVDIATTENFDGQTITPPVPNDLNLTGQEILLKNKANCANSCEFTQLLTDNSGLTGNRFYDIPILLPLNPLIEIGDFNVNNVAPNVVQKNGGLDNISFPLPDGQDDFDNYFQFMYLYAPNNDECVSSLDIDWSAKGTFKVTPNYNGTITIDLRAYKRNPITNGDLNDLGTVNIASGATLTNGVMYSVAFDESFGGTTAQPIDGSFIVYAWHVNIFKSSASGTDTTQIEIDYDSLSVNYFNMQADSVCAPSIATSFYIPELLEFLPSVYMDEDCPSMEIKANLKACLYDYSITKGSFIRNVTEPSTPKLFTSFEYLFEQCRKIFNIGWGFDNNETELKIANVQDFYNSNIVVDVGLVDKATFSTATDLIYGTINVGYNKWEAEEYNGLDETNTERQYRRNIDSNPTELDLMCDMISAGYTIEITRRKNQARTGTSDWRYDDDLFIINTFLEDDELYNYRGIDNGAANVYSPSTRMNYVLTPIRNLLRWFKSICAPTPITANEELIFTSGTGNYIAQGEMTALCQLENQVINENENINSTLLEYAIDKTPIWQTIYATFNAPFSMANFESVKLNPYGAIRFRCSDSFYTGNIVEINHDPIEGLAQFKLLIRR